MGFGFVAQAGNVHIFSTSANGHGQCAILVGLLLLPAYPVQLQL